MTFVDALNKAIDPSVPEACIGPAFLALARRVESHKEMIALCKAVMHWAKAKHTVAMWSDRDCFQALLSMTTYVTSPKAVERYGAALVHVFFISPVHFGTPELYSAVMKVVPYATTAAAAQAIATVMMHATFENEGNQRVFGTTECRDAFVGLLRCATTDEALRWVMFAFTSVTNDNKEVQLFFGTSDVRDALIAAVAHVTSADTVQWVANGMYNVVSVAQHRDTFGTSQLVDAVVSLAAHATTTNAVHWVASVLSQLASGSATRQALLGTIAMRDSLIRMYQYATTEGSVKRLLMAVADINHDVPLAPFGTPEMVECLLRMYALFPESAGVDAAFATVVGNVCRTPEIARVYSTEGVGDRLIGIARRAANDSQCDNVARAIAAVATSNERGQALFCSDQCVNALVEMANRCPHAQWFSLIVTAVVTDNPSNLIQYGNESVRGAWLSLSELDTSLDSERHLALALSALVKDHATNKSTHFGKKSVCDALMVMLDRVRSTEAAQAVTFAIHSLANNNEPVKGFFALNGINLHRAICSVMEFATTREAVEALANAIASLSRNQLTNQTLLGTPSMCSAFVHLALNATTPDASGALGQAIANLAESNLSTQSIFATPNVRDCLVCLGARATSATALRSVAAAFAHVSQHNPALFGVVEVRNTLLLFAHRASTLESLEQVSTAIFWICSFDANKALFQDPEALAAIKDMKERLRLLRKEVRNTSSSSSSGSSCNCCDSSTCKDVGEVLECIAYIILCPLLMLGALG